MESILFYSFAALSVAGSILVVSFSRTLSSAIALVGTLFGVASLFVLLSAHFVAAMQILLYAGAIMVLFVFVILLLGLGPAHPRRKFYFRSLFGIASGLYLFLLFLMKIVPMPSRDGPPLPKDYGTLKAIGRHLFVDQLIAFEAVSLLLLVAVIGVVVLTKRPTRGMP